MDLLFTLALLRCLLACWVNYQGMQHGSIPHEEIDYYRCNFRFWSGLGVGIVARSCCSGAYIYFLTSITIPNHCIGPPVVHLSMYATWEIKQPK